SKIQDLNRCSALRECSVAQLAAAVSAPCPHGAVTLQRHAERTARGNGDNSVLRSKPQRDRCSLRSCGSIAELTVGVQAPCQDGSIVHQRQTVRIARGERNNVAAGPQTDDLNRRCLVRGSCASSVSKLAVRVQSPAPHTAVGLSCKVV